MKDGRSIAGIILGALLVGLALFLARRDSPEATETTKPPAPAAEKPETSQATGPVRGDTLVLGVSADLDFLNPILYQTQEAGYVLGYLFPGLTQNRFDCEMQYAPALAERWEWNEEQTELTFHLRKDSKWSDGELITAEDIIFTFDRVADPAVNSPRFDHLERMRKENPVTKLDDHTVRFHFESAYDRAQMLAHATEVAILPAHLLRDVPPGEMRSAEFNRQPLGAGPFRFKEWTKGQEIIFERNESWEGAVPWLERLVVRIIPDYATRLTELKRGNIDLMEQIQVRDLESLAENPDLRVVSRGYRYMDYIVWNLKNPLFSSKKVRRALAHAVDCDRIIDSLLQVNGVRYGKRSYSNITPEICDFDASNIEAIDHDVVRARALLAEEGWKDSDGDGFLDRAGKKFSFALLINAGTPRRILAAQIVQEMLRKVGVECRIEKMEWVKMNEEIRARNFEAAALGWGSGLWPDPTNTLHSGEEYVYNFGNYANERVDELLDQLGQVSDPEKSRGILQEIMQIVYEDQPFLCLYWFGNLAAVHQRFRNVNINMYGLLSDLEAWWVPAEEQKYK